MFESADIKALPGRVNDLESKLKTAVDDFKSGQTRLEENYLASQRGIIRDVDNRISEVEKRYDERAARNDDRIKTQFSETKAYAATQIESLRTEYKASAAGMHQEIAGMQERLRTLNGVIGVVDINKPDTTDAKTVLSFLKETGEQEYDAFRSKALLQTAALGKTGVLIGNEGDKYRLCWTRNGDVVMDNTSYGISGVTIDVDDVRISFARQAYLSRGEQMRISDILVDEKSPEAVVRVDDSDEMTPILHHGFAAPDNVRDMSKYRGGGIGVRLGDYTPRLSIMHKKNDRFGQRLIDELPAMWTALAYGAFQAQLERGDMENAAQVFSTHLSDVKSGPLYDDLMSAVQANPGFVRYLQPVIDTLERS